MWGLASTIISSFGWKKSLTDISKASLECSDDEICSNGSREEGLECHICWESFNIVENVPYVLWCGHTLCKNCVLGLQCAVLKFPTQQTKIPFCISCPWCNLLSLRLVYKGNLKFPRKNFFLLWMVESLNDDRLKCASSSNRRNQQNLSPNSNLAIESSASDSSPRRPSFPNSRRLSRFNGNARGGNANMHYFSLNKSLDFFIHLTSKFPLVIIFLFIIFFAIPGSAIILAIYFLLTVFFAIPSLLILYFSCPTLESLVREITS